MTDTPRRKSFMDARTSAARISWYYNNARRVGHTQLSLQGAIYAIKNNIKTLFICYDNKSCINIFNELRTQLEIAEPNWQGKTNRRDLQIGAVQVVTVAQFADMRGFYHHAIIWDNFAIQNLLYTLSVVPE